MQTRGGRINVDKPSRAGITSKEETVHSGQQNGCWVEEEVCVVVWRQRAFGGPAKREAQRLPAKKLAENWVCHVTADWTRPTWPACSIPESYRCCASH